MGIRFTKMHSLGNDFMVIDGVRQKINLTPPLIQAWSHRHTGIGFDQCLLVESSNTPDVDFFYRIFNANGHEVGQCGNGARCLARFLLKEGLIDKTTIQVATMTAKMTLQVHEDQTVTVDLGKPLLAPTAIPLLAKEEARHYNIPLTHHNEAVHAINVGNPHAVIVVPDLNTVDVALLGQSISEHPLFPEQTNVGFMQIENTHTIHLRVYERDCGETHACGSGAVAAAAIGHLFYQLTNPTQVHMQGGQLTVTWPDKQGHIYLTGPAEFIYEGTESLCVSSF